MSADTSPSTRVRIRDSFESPPPLAPPEPPAPRPPLWRRRPWMIGGGVAAVLLLLFAWISWALPVGRALEPLPSPTLVLVTADGKPFARRGSYKEAPVSVAELPEHVTGAFVAVEDRRFYRHWGLDLRSIARALRNNARAGEVEEGGSTITQQLAKNAFLSNERTLRRKAQEALIALYLEARLSKEEILSRYLSSVYFGDGVFGLRAAARHYFNKAPDDLSLGEAALLAGIVKAPSRLAPTEDIAAARTRARTVLATMVETGVITEAEARGAARRVRVREGRPDLPVGSYFADWVSPEAKASFERAYGEVIVQTTLDSRLQAQAEQILRRTLAASGPRVNATQGALVAMRTNGEIVAMVGGRDYRQSQFNRATQAKRQPGSAFKLFVYLAALRRGASPELTVLDTPLTVGDWSPENYEGEYAGGPITLREAFARSSNVAAVRLAQQAGLRNVARAARDLGIKGELPNNPTLALGTSETTLLDLTAAYAGVAAGQAPVQPHGVAGMEPRGRTRRLRDEERRAMLDLLRAVVTSGTGRAANLGVPAFGKTGTSQDYRDAWFIGFAGDLVVGVWIGNDDNSPMRNVAGGGLPTQIWRGFMGYALSRGDFGGGVEFEEPERGLEIFPQDDEPGADPFLPEAPPEDPELEPLFREDEVLAPPPPEGGPAPGPPQPQPLPPPPEPVEEEVEVEDDGG